MMLVPKNILDFTVYSQWGKKGEQAMVYMLMEGPKSWLYELLNYPSSITKHKVIIINI